MFGGLGSRVLGFRVWDLGFGVAGFRIYDFGFRASGFRIYNLGFRVSGFRTFGVWALGLGLGFGIGLRICSLVLRLRGFACALFEKVWKEKTIGALILHLY